MTATVVLIAAIVCLSMVLIGAHARYVIAKRQLYDHSRQMSKERKATAAILGLSGEVIDSDISDSTFLAKFIEYAVRALQGTGAAVVTIDENGEFVGCAVAGTFPPLRDVPAQVEQQLLAHPRRHSAFFQELLIPFAPEDVKPLLKDKKYLYSHDEHPDFLPDFFKSKVAHLIISPVYVRSELTALVFVISGDDFDMYKLTDEDGHYLARLNEIATLSMEAIRAFRERREYEEQVQTAREEGMMQVSAGIIHNIGNAVTVAKLSVHELLQKCSVHSKDSPETLILNELLPQIQANLDSGKLQDFLLKDDVGSQYLDIMKELLGHISKTKDDSSVLLDSLSEKLKHISEIIELQQHFVGELGTENMVSLSSVIDSSVKIFEETCNKHDVSISTEYEDEVPQVLIDTSMMTQVFMNLIKNAVEAMDSEKDTKKKHALRVVLKRVEKNDIKDVVAEVVDNGPGMPEDVCENIFKFGFSTKSNEEHSSRGYGLHSCLNTVKKYGGDIQVESEVGKGTTFRIILPLTREETGES
ncbi:MAG: GHKL domain-containing protein [Kiritimatiellaeota bacterium]|nr:GHKL domain-containing protein [Kiritimatiellota bacterium]